jgi:hypothetical protein
MVHDVLQSDIEFARALMQSNQADTEVVSALCRRGVEPAKASRLVEDLRNNVPVTGTLPPLPGFRSERRRSRPAEPKRSEPVAETHTSERRSHHRRSSIPWWFLIIAAISIWAIGYCLWHDDKNTADYEKHAIPAKPGSKE